ncbi:MULTISPECIES: hypothetical protein [Niallia]|jgi:hypothetical protein|nr:hypothetical protein [Niallia circulans]MCM2980027.1 hypothetical protein [Niallia circulans]NRG34607.1 hypothetical protein [Niallia circulans]
MKGDKKVHMFMVVTIIAFIFACIWVLMDTIYFSKPPKPEVLWKNNRIPTTIGSNCWQGSLKGSCVDYVYASPWDMGLQNGSVKVEPNSTITIDFNKKPLAGSLQVAEVFEDGEEEFIKVDKNKMTVPAKKGTYVYMIYAKWDQGNPNYTFSIRVE